MAKRGGASARGLLDLYGEPSQASTDQCIAPAPELSRAPVIPPIATLSTDDQPTSMDQTALVFLDDPIARKLAVAWKVCRGANDQSWLAAAGMAPSSAVRALMSALKLNGICRSGGLTDPMAMTYIQAMIARSLPSAAKSKKGS